MWFFRNRLHLSSGKSASVWDSAVFADYEGTKAGVPRTDGLPHGMFMEAVPGGQASREGSPHPGPPLNLQRAVSDLDVSFRFYKMGSSSHPSATRQRNEKFFA